MNKENNTVKKAEKKSIDLTSVISTAIQVPGVKVVREDFLREQFKDFDIEFIEEIVAKGPVEAGCKREDIQKKAKRIIKSRTAVSTGASFIAGIPGGLAMAATIPTDIVQFYAVALRMAQELAYLYGEADMWCDSTPDADRITNQLVLYYGVMLGASGAAQSVRVMSSALAKQALKKLPQQALTKTFYYPIIKSILKFFGVSITKSSFAKGVSKVIPVVGGVVSGGITLASLLPMGNRLANTFDKAHFDYTDDDFEADWRDITEVCEQNEKDEAVSAKDEAVEQVEAPDNTEEILDKIRRSKQLLEDGIITEEEFCEIKAKLISQI